MKKLLPLFLFVGTACLSKDEIRHFKKEVTPLDGQPVITNVEAIVKIAHETAEFLKKIKKHPSKFITVTPGLFSEFGITIDDVLETLEFIATTGKRKPHLLQSPWFLNTHFTFYRWHGDPQAKVNQIHRGWEKPPAAIVTTQYRITQVPARFRKMETYTYPLYACPTDEKGLTPQERSKKKNELLRFKYTAQEIHEGALEHLHHVKIIGWLEEAGYKDFAMQGSAELLFTDGTKKLVQVAGNNDMNEKDRYWFAEYVAPVRKTKFPEKVRPMADVTYAGDIDLLGFGKVILLLCWNPKLERKEIRLGVLVDTGSAFKGNLTKLDMFTGYFPTHALFQSHITSYPHTARAYILIKKKS